MSNEELMLLIGAVLVIAGIIVRKTKTKTDDAIYERIKALFDKFKK